jgi:hypothetical protein
MDVMSEPVHRETGQGSAARQPDALPIASGRAGRTVRNRVKKYDDNSFM